MMVAGNNNSEIGNGDGEFMFAGNTGGTSAEVTHLIVRTVSTFLITSRRQHVPVSDAPSICALLYRQMVDTCTGEAMGTLSQF